MNERVVAIGGPGAAQPRLVHTLLGASLDELTAGELIDSNQRVISGSVLAGRTAQGPLAYLGRYDLQVSILPEDAERKLLGLSIPRCRPPLGLSFIFIQVVRREERQIHHHYPWQHARYGAHWHLRCGYAHGHSGDTTHA